MSNHERRMCTIIIGTGKPMLAQKESRNQKCKCGSGLKSKKCCGVVTKYYTKKEKE